MPWGSRQSAAREGLCMKQAEARMGWEGWLCVKRREERGGSAGRAWVCVEHGGRALLGERVHGRNAAGRGREAQALDVCPDVNPCRGWHRAHVCGRELL